MKIQLFFLSLISLMGLSACAQQPDPIASDWQHQIENLRQQMQSAERFGPDTLVPGNGRREFLQISPDSSSYFYFRVDTSFGGDLSKFFRFDTDPFGTPGPDDADPFAEMFRRMEEMQRQMGVPPLGFSPFDKRSEVPDRQQPRSRQPADDGNRPTDELLPEEKLRLENPAEQDTSTQKPAPVKKPKLNTTRI